MQYPPSLRCVSETLVNLGLELKIPEVVNVILSGMVSYKPPDPIMSKLCTFPDSAYPCGICYPLVVSSQITGLCCMTVFMFK